MLHEFEMFLREKGKAENTIQGYISDLELFFRDIKSKPGAFVTEPDVRKWISGLLHPKEGKPLAVSSINRKLNALRSFFSWGVREKRFSTNPMADIQDVRTADEESENIMWLSEEEFEAYLDRMKKAPVKSRGVNKDEKYHRDRAIIYTFTYAGLRLEELSNLQLSHVDLELRKMRIVGKGQKVRTIPISVTLLPELEAWFKFRAEMAKKKLHVAESPYVFYSQRSPQMTRSAIYKMVESYSPKDKVITPHMFRHTFCKWMLKANNNDLEKVRRLAGHTSIQTTSRYLKDSYSELTDAVDAMPKF